MIFSVSPQQTTSGPTGGSLSCPSGFGLYHGADCGCSVSGGPCCTPPFDSGQQAGDAASEGGDASHD